MTNNTNGNMKTPSYTNHNGYLMPHGFPAHNFANSLSYKPTSNDLFIATYPKCGTTLTQHMIYIMLNKGVPIQPHEKLDQIFPHLEEVGADYITNSATIKRDLRLIKTHLPYDMTPMSTATAGAKYIFVARNPKDCIVSFFHHTRGFPQHYNFEDGDFDVYFDLFVRGQVDFGNYFTALRSWFDRRHDENVLFLTYEEIQADKRRAVIKIASFIDGAGAGGTMEEELLRDNGALMEKVLLCSSLEEMKKDPLRWCSERAVEHTPFIRSGQVGGWTELLTKAQGEKLDEIMRQTFTEEELKYLGTKY